MRIHSPRSSWIPIAIVVFLFLSAADARCATKEACERYAQESVRQNQENEKLGAGFRPPVWSNDYRGHYSWCMHGENVKTTAGHLQNRERQLQEHALRKSDPCARYAAQSVRQYKENVKRGAGFQPPVWSGDSNAHYNWCKHGGNARTTPGHLADREGKLQLFVLQQKAATPSADVTVAQPEFGVAKPTTPAPGVLGNIAQYDPDAPVIDVAASKQTVGKVLVPLLMYYVERRLTGMPTTSETEKAMERAVNASPGTRNLYAEILRNYKSIPLAEKKRLFDGKAVEQTANPSKAIHLESFRSKLVGAMKAERRTDIFAFDREAQTPAAPTRLVAVPASGKEIDTQVFDYRITLQWRWDAPKQPFGFAVYRKKPEDKEFAFLKSVGGNERVFRDTSLPKPQSVDDGYCYEVRAYNKPFVTSTVGSSNRIESKGSNPACTPYHPSSTVKESDQDGISDPWDWCPQDGRSAEVPRVNGCPDGDMDGFADFIQDQSIPYTYKDNCPPDAPAQDGYANRGYQWSHLRPYDQLPGCPIKYNLRFMGMEVLNGPIDCTNPNNPGGTKDCDKSIGLGNEYGQTNEIINGKKLPPGQEPYLVFALTNGISVKGMDESWTKKWCCGEGVVVDSYNWNLIPNKAPAAGLEPDNDFTGSEDPSIDQDVLGAGYIVLPETFNDSVIIDQHGMTLTATLFERDFDMKYTPTKNAQDIGDLVQGTLGVVGEIMQCTASGKLTDKDCNKKIGGKVLEVFTTGALTVLTTGFADVISSFFGGSNKPADVIVKDTDDVYGIASVGFTPNQAAANTGQNGAYGFFFRYPVANSTAVEYHTSYVGSIHPPPAPDSPSRKVANMVARANFCLVRKGVDESKVKQLCSPYSYEYMK